MFCTKEMRKESYGSDSHAYALATATDELLLVMLLCKERTMWELLMVKRMWWLCEECFRLIVSNTGVVCGTELYDCCNCNKRRRATTAQGTQGNPRSSPPNQV